MSLAECGIGSQSWIQRSLLDVVRVLTLIIVLVIVPRGTLDGSSGLQAAPPTDWEVMAIFIPAAPDQQRQFIPRIYVPIEIEDLEARLAQEQTRRREALFNATTLSEAVYLARIDGELLISDLSRWKFVGPNTAQSINLGNVSVALRDAVGVEPSRLEQLSTYQRFDTAGGIELSFQETSAERWFGFTKNARKTELGARFDMQLPAAALAKLIVSVPNNYLLRSDEVVVGPISELSGSLPLDWPTPLREPARLTSGRQWWEVNISGRNSFTLDLIPTQENASLLYKHALSACEVDYRVGDLRLTVNNKFVVASSSKGAPLQLRLSSSLRLKSVKLDGVSVAWRPLSSPSEDGQSFEIVDFAWSGRDATVEVTATSIIGDEPQVKLPELAVIDAYAMSGTTRVTAQQGRTIDNVESPGLSYTPQSSDTSSAALPSTTGLSSTAATETNADLVWSGSWMGRPPEVTASFSRRRNGWQLRGLTRFNVQSAWLAANARMGLNCNRLNSNEVRLQVNPDWFVDSLRLINEADTDFRVQFVETGSGPERRTEIVVGWERRRDSLSVELEVAAHSPKETESAKLSLGELRLVTLPNADQQDNFVVEAAGRFRLPATAELLRFQLSSSELPVWQQALLPQSSNVWIFSDSRSTMPPIELLASGGTYTTQVHTLVVRRDERHELSYRISCRPISGNIDRLRLTFPIDVELGSLAFELIQSNEENSVVVPFEVREPVAGAVDREVDLQLPSPMNVPFEIRGTAKSLPLDAPLRIAVPGFPASVSAESVIILPRQLTSFVGRPALELLPVEACCTGEEVALFESDLAGQLPTTYAAARLEATNSQLLEVRPASRAALEGWLWKESIEHRLWDDGSREHRVVWDLEVSEQSSLNFQLPTGWNLERVLIDGQAMDNGQGPQPPQALYSQADSAAVSGMQSMVLQVPTNHRSLIVLECSSQLMASGGTLPVLTQVHLAKPRVSSLPTFESRSRVYIAPSNIALSSLPKTNASLKLSDRLLPRQWWSLLAPRAFTETTWNQNAFDSADRELRNTQRPAETAGRATEAGWDLNGWSRVDISEDTSELAADGSQSISLWVIDRAALRGLLTAAVLFLGVGFWNLIGRATRLWWLVLALLAVLVILVPREWLLWSQLLLLASVMAAFGRLLQVVTRNQRLHKTGESRQVIRVSTIGRSLLVWLAIIAWGSPTLSAQSAAPVRAGSTIQSRSLPQLGTNSIEMASNAQNEAGRAASQPQIFGVLLPIDEKANIDGVYAYIPTQLWKLLTAPDTATAKMGPPQILAADYLLRVRPGSSNAELSAEFRVQVTEANSELRLPFRASELALTSGQVNGEQRLIGLQSLMQNATEVVFLSNKTGTFNVSLQFVTTASVRSDRAQFQATIPPIPNATMRIDAEGVNVDVNALGAVQQRNSGELLANLGPVERLVVSWSESMKRDSAAPLDITSEAWVHGAGPQVLAACRLRYGKNQGLPSTLHIYIDSDWEPVGTTWGDAEISPSETMSFGNRRVYTARLIDTRNDDATEYSISTLLVPRQDSTTNALALPFMSLQEVSPTATRRVLSWSSDAASLYKPDGVDFWPQVTGEAHSWGALALAAQKRTFRVPPGTGPLQLRRQANRPTATVDEVTNVHYATTGERIDYLASWSNGSAQPSVVRLHVPRDAKLTTLSVNGRNAEYRLSDRGEMQLLLIPIASQQIEQLSTLEVSFERRPQFETPHPVARVVLDDPNIRSSRVRLFRGVMLDVELQHRAEEPLRSYQIAGPETQFLDSLEQLVSEYELGNAFRAQPYLPLTAQLIRREAPASQSCIMRLWNGPNGWLAEVVTTWNAAAKIDFAFFDVPLSARDNLSAGTLARKFMPTADTSRTTLCLIPKVLPSGEREVTFSFPLGAAASGQSLSVPQVRLLADHPTAPLVGLPKVLDGQAVVWQKAGRRIAMDELAGVTPSWFDDFEFYLTPENLSQIGWQSLESQRLSPRIENVTVEITSISANRVAAIVNYWVAPRGQLEMQFRIAENCSVLGVEVSGAAALWNLIDTQGLNVSLQPNYLPVNMVLLLQWDVDDPDKQLSIEVPQPLVDQIQQDMLVSITAELPFELVTSRPVDSLDSPDESQLLKRWVIMLATTVKSQTSVKPNELRTWLASWHPSRFGFSEEATIDPSWTETLSRDLDDDEDGSVKLIEFWQGLVPDPEAAPSTSLNMTSNAISSLSGIKAGSFALTGRPRYWVALAGNRLTFAPPNPRERLMPRVLAAALLAAFALLALAVAARLRGPYFELLSNHAWAYWLQLAAIAWVLLPLAWPSWVIAAIAMVMLFSQLTDRRGRRTPQAG